ncbi:MAG: glycerophosphodiester phosphodiesterase [Actinomycetota bacterium]|nr:glycerophosphodiester phosphodiesterase [Rubrobacter sp.]MDQ3509504.1 glycerophosphodiester phosphodiesterase [Actinomycetota bacterium]
MKWKWKLVFAGVAGIFVAALLRGERKTRDPRWPTNLAHRGASVRAPENTMEAFRIGLDEGGAGGLEMDAHLTRDGEVVIIHDDDVDRMTDGTGFARDMTLEEIRRLDAGYRFSPDGASFPYRGRGLRIPTLREVYESFPEAAVNVELKEDQSGIQESVLDLIEEFDAERRTLVASFGYSIMRHFRRVSGGRVSTSASRFEISVFYFASKVFLEKFVPVNYDALQVPTRHRGLEIVTPRFIKAAHSRGVRVDVWTVNDGKEMGRLLDLGADVIMTDEPEKLSKTLAERKPEA